MCAFYFVGTIGWKRYFMTKLTNNCILTERRGGTATENDEGDRET